MSSNSKKSGTAPTATKEAIKASRITKAGHNSRGGGKHVGELAIRAGGTGLGSGKTFAAPIRKVEAPVSSNNQRFAVTMADAMGVPDSLKAVATTYETRIHDAMALTADRVEKALTAARATFGVRNAEIERIDDDTVEVFLPVSNVAFAGDSERRSFRRRVENAVSWLLDLVEIECRELRLGLIDKEGFIAEIKASYDLHAAKDSRDTLVSALFGAAA